MSTDLLLFPIRIKDKRNQAVQGLTESELSLEDKDRVTTGLYFTPGADRVALVFALDQSGSLREIISQQREAALALFRRFSDRSSIAVLRFAEVPAVVAPFERDPGKAQFGIQPVSRKQSTYSDIRCRRKGGHVCLKIFLACALNVES